MCSLRSVQIKLVDLGSCQKVSKLGNKVNKCGHLEYSGKIRVYYNKFQVNHLISVAAPEMLDEEDAYPQTDIWSLGVLTYIMLSGVHPFKGADAAETRQNIMFVRYRFEHLYKEASQEAIRFLMLLFKRSPR